MNCESCLRDEIEVPSTWYCSECEERLCDECRKHHGRNKLTTGHTVLAIDTDVSCTDKQTAAILKDIKTSCEKHKTRTIEYVCVTDRALCCTDCVIVTHRKCETVLTLAEYKKSSEFRQEAETRHRLLKEIRINADVVKSTVDEFAEKVAHSKEHFESCLKNILSQIATKANAMFKAKHSVASLETADRLSGEMGHILEDDTTKPLNFAEKHGTITKELVSAFNMTKVLESQNEEVEKAIRFLGQLKETQLKVNTNAILQAIEDNFQVKSIGFAIGRPSLQSMIHVKTPNMIRKCTLIGKIVLLACSRNESTLSSFDVESGNPIASVDLKSSPWDIAKRDDSHLLVTLPWANKIVQIQFRQTKLEASFIETETAFYCIKFCTEKDFFVVSSKATGNFYFINWSGDVLKLISIQPMKAKLVAFQNKIPSYVDDIAIDSNKQLIFASATKMNKIFMIDFDGALKQVYNHPSIEHPMGITNGPGNSMLVCSYGNNQVHELRARDCSHGYCSTRSILTHTDGLRGPMDVCYDVSSNQLVVCEVDAHREIKTFKID